MNRCLMIICVAGLFHATPTSAAVIKYDSLSTFDANAGVVQTEDFNAFAPASGLFLASTFDFGDFSVIVTTDSPALGVEGSVIGSGLVNGTVELGLGVEDDSSTETRFEFDQAITAFGFDAYDLADAGRVASLSFNNVSADSVSIADPLNGNTRFWGFVSDTPFTTISFTQVSGAADGFRLDNLVYSANTAAVPEPGSLILMSVGAISLIGYRRRQRKEAA
ncbi:MAG: PEP-CTERM sorting domain-containing protein [Fuerstiella sp.]